MPRLAVEGRRQRSEESLLWFDKVGAVVRACSTSEAEGAKSIHRSSNRGWCCRSHRARSDL